MTELQLEQAKHNLEEAQVYINKMRNNLELLEVDKFKDLKKAYDEDAIIEYKSNYDWLICKPLWSVHTQYRIKGGISISSWQAHKDIIKQYWDGAEIETDIANTGVWKPLNTISDIQTKANSYHYRVKQKWKLPEYKDGSEYTINMYGTIRKRVEPEATRAGRRRATRALAERCAKASKQRDLLEAWRDHIEPTWVDDMDIFAYYLYVDSYEKYTVLLDTNTRTVGTVYGSQETMQKICDVLNNGEITLD